MGQSRMDERRCVECDTPLQDDAGYRVPELDGSLCWDCFIVAIEFREGIE